MAKRRRSRTRITRPRKERMRSLPTTPGTTIHYVNPDTIVVVEQKAGTGGGAGERPKIKVCTCSKTDFVCTNEGGITVCREQCTQWDCTIVEVSPA